MPTHAALKYRLKVLGVNLSEEKLDQVYEDFLVLADKKKVLHDDDLLMLAGADRAHDRHIKVDWLQATSGIGMKPSRAKNSKRLQPATVRSTRPSMPSVRLSAAM